jgi:hypothetical protein
LGGFCMALHAKEESRRVIAKYVSPHLHSSLFPV